MIYLEDQQYILNINKTQIQKNNKNTDIYTGNIQKLIVKLTNYTYFNIQTFISQNSINNYIKNNNKNKKLPIKIIKNPINNKYICIINNLQLQGGGAACCTAKSNKNKNLNNENNQQKEKSKSNDKLNQNITSKEKSSQKEKSQNNSKSQIKSKQYNQKLKGENSEEDNDTIRIADIDINELKGEYKQGTRSADSKLVRNQQRNSILKKQGSDFLQKQLSQNIKEDKNEQDSINESSNSDSDSQNENKYTNSPYNFKTNQKQKEDSIELDDLDEQLDYGLQKVGYLKQLTEISEQILVNQSENVKRQKSQAFSMLSCEIMSTEHKSVETRKIKNLNPNAKYKKIMNKWEYEFGPQTHTSSQEFCQACEYFLQNIFIAVENNPPIQDIIISAVSNMTTIDYPKNQKYKTLGERCMKFLKDLYAFHGPLKLQIEDSLKDIIFQNLTTKTLDEVKQIVINGLLDVQESFDITHLLNQQVQINLCSWVQQIEEMLNNQQEKYDKDVKPKKKIKILVVLQYINESLKSDEFCEEFSRIINLNYLFTILSGYDERQSSINKKKSIMPGYTQGFQNKTLQNVKGTLNVCMKIKIIQTCYKICKDSLEHSQQEEDSLLQLIHLKISVIDDAISNIMDNLDYTEAYQQDLLLKGYYKLQATLFSCFNSYLSHVTIDLNLILGYSTNSENQKFYNASQKITQPIFQNIFSYLTETEPQDPLVLMECIQTVRLILKAATFSVGDLDNKKKLIQEVFQNIEQCKPLLNYLGTQNTNRSFYIMWCEDYGYLYNEDNMQTFSKNQKSNLQPGEDFQDIQFLQNDTLLECIFQIISLLELLFTPSKRPEIQKTLNNTKQVLYQFNLKQVLLDCMRSTYEPIRISSSKLMLLGDENHFMWDIDNLKYVNKLMVNQYMEMLSYQQGEVEISNILILYCKILSQKQEKSQLLQHQFYQYLGQATIASSLEILTLNMERDTKNQPKETKEKIELSQTCIQFLRLLINYPTLRPLMNNVQNSAMIKRCILAENNLMTEDQGQILSEELTLGIEILLNILEGQDKISHYNMLSFRILQRIADTLQGKIYEKNLPYYTTFLLPNMNEQGSIEQNKFYDQNGTLSMTEYIADIQREKIILQIREEYEWPEIKQSNILKDLAYVYEVQHYLFGNQNASEKLILFIENKDRLDNIKEDEDCLVELIDRLKAGNGVDIFQKKTKKKSDEPEEIIQQKNNINKPQKGIKINTEYFKKKIKTSGKYIQFFTQKHKEKVKFRGFENKCALESKAQYANGLKGFNDNRVLELYIQQENQEKTNLQIQHNKELIFSTFLRCIYSIIFTGIDQSVIKQAKEHFQKSLPHVFRICQQLGWTNAYLGKKILFLINQIVEAPEIQILTDNQIQNQTLQTEQSTHKSKLQKQNPKQQQHHQTNQQYKNYFKTITQTVKAIESMVLVLKESALFTSNLFHSDLILIKQILETLLFILEQLPFFPKFQECYQAEQPEQHPGKNCNLYFKVIKQILQKMIPRSLVDKLTHLLFNNKIKKSQEQLELIIEIYELYTDFMGNLLSWSTNQRIEDYLDIIMNQDHEVIVSEGDQKPIIDIDTSFLNEIIDDWIGNNLTHSLQNYILYNHLVQNFEKILSSGWCYIKENPEENNKKMFFIFTPTHLFVFQIEFQHKCEECQFGSLCSEKYSLYITLELEKSDKSQKNSKSKKNKNKDNKKQENNLNNNIFKLKSIYKQLSVNQSLKFMFYRKNQQGLFNNKNNESQELSYIEITFKSSFISKNVFKLLRDHHIKIENDSKKNIVIDKIFQNLQVPGDFIITYQKCGIMHILHNDQIKQIFFEKQQDFILFLVLNETQQMDDFRKSRQEKDLKIQIQNQEQKVTGIHNLQKKQLATHELDIIKQNLQKLYNSTHHYDFYTTLEYSINFSQNQQEFYPFLDLIPLNNSNKQSVRFYFLSNFDRNKAKSDLIGDSYKLQRKQLMIINKLQDKAFDFQKKFNNKTSNIDFIKQRLSTFQEDLNASASKNKFKSAFKMLSKK